LGLFDAGEEGAEVGCGGGASGLVVGLEDGKARVRCGRASQGAGRSRKIAVAWGEVVAGVVEGVAVSGAGSGYVETLKPSW